MRQSFQREEQCPHTPVPPGNADLTSTSGLQTPVLSAERRWESNDFPFKLNWGGKKKNKKSTLHVFEHETPIQMVSAMFKPFGLLPYAVSKFEECLLGMINIPPPTLTHYS